MTKTINIILIAVGVLFNNLCAGESSRFKIDNAELTAHDTYDSTSVYDYMNGGAIMSTDLISWIC